MAAYVSRHALHPREIQSSGRWPNIGVEIASIVIHFIGIGLISGMMSRKFGWMLERVSLARILVAINLVAAWSFLFTITIVVDSIGMEHSLAVCAAGFWACLFFYGLTKFTIYCFLAERVYIVFNSVELTEGRLRCKPYLLSMVFFVGYAGVWVTILLYRVAYISDEGLCIIGQGLVSSFLLLSYDSFVNIFLTALFVWPLFACTLTPSLRILAKRSLWASAIALFGSSFNVIYLALVHRRERGWLCLAACGCDVIVNAGVMYWITSGVS